VVGGCRRKKRGGRELVSRRGPHARFLDTIVRVYKRPRGGREGGMDGCETLKRRGWREEVGEGLESGRKQRNGGREGGREGGRSYRPMHHQPDIRLVNAHTKRTRGRHNLNHTLAKQPLNLLPLLNLRMVCFGGNPPPRQLCSQQIAIRRLPTIDNGTPSLPPSLPPCYGCHYGGNCCSCCCC